MDDLAPNGQKMKINKTEAEYNMKSIRFLLLTITSMFLVIAALMVVLGISVYGHYHNFAHFIDSAKSGHFITPSIMSVFLGLFLMVVSLFGFFGSLKQSTCMVNIYALLLGFIFVGKLIVVILALTLKEDTIVQNIYVQVNRYAEDPEIQAEIDALQTQLGCCGFVSYLDYKGMEFNSNHSTVVVTKENEFGVQMSLVLPGSCCITAEDVLCSRMWATGCQTALMEFLMQYAIVIGVLGISVMFINILGIIFALLLARCIRKSKSVKTLMMWKIKEQFILGRQAEEAMKSPTDRVFIEEQASSTA